jgi:hypothetical protein
MANTRTLSANPLEAQRLGLDYFDLFINDWGQVASAQGLTYGTSQGDQPIPSVAGVQVHPQSDIDRVLVKTSVGPSNQLGGPGGNQTALPGEQLTVRTVEVSVDAPMIVAAPSVYPANITKELILLAAPDTYWPATYLKRGNPNPQVFGPDLGSSVWCSPLLALRFFIRPNLAGPQGRAPFNMPNERANLGGNGTNTPANPVNLVPDQETLFAVLPVHGRKSARISFRPTGTAAPTIRVAALDLSAIASSISIERNITTIAALPANSTQWVEFSPQTDFILLYYTLPFSSGAGTLQYSFHATDHGPGATVVGP